MSKIFSLKYFFKFIYRASIVPVISFGENNLYHTVNLPDLPSSSSLILNYIQKTFKSIIGFPLKIFYGNLLFFPYRKPVWTVGKYIVAFDIVFFFNLFANNIVFSFVSIVFFNV